jgi:hypothetical protein
VTDGNQATSDGDGRLELRLTPGEYTLIADPAWNEPYVTTEQQIVVSEETREQEIALALARGGTVVLSAIDIASGKPLAGVDFLVGPDTSPERQVLQSQTVIVDNPATDAEGRLQATLPAGSYQFIVGTVPAGYEAIRKTSDPCTLAAGETQDVRFEFRRVSPKVDAAAPPATSNESPYPADLVEKWTRQRNLRTRGRAKLSVIRAPFSWLYKDKLEGILAAADPEKIPDLIGALEREYPEQTIVFGEMEIASDGSRHREVHSYAGKISSVLAANGKEGVEFHPDNAQADVFARSHFRVGLFNIRELSYWPQPSARPANVNPNDAPRVDVETVGERLKITLRPAAAEPAAWTSSISLMQKRASSTARSRTMERTASSGGSLLRRSTPAARSCQACRSSSLTATEKSVCSRFTGLRAWSWTANFRSMHSPCPHRRERTSWTTAMVRAAIPRVLLPLSRWLTW